MVSTAEAPKLERGYKVGEKVIYTVQFNCPGHMAPKERIIGTVISVFGKSPTYRIELNVVWSKRVQPHSWGKKIIVGNVCGRSLSPSPQLVK